MFKQSVLSLTPFLEGDSPATVTVTITTNAGAEILADYEVKTNDQLVLFLNGDSRYSTLDVAEVVSRAVSDCR